MATCVANIATCIAQVALPKLVHNALLINKLWFGLAFLKASFSTDKDGLDCSLELETFFQLSLNKVSRILGPVV